MGPRRRCGRGVASWLLGPLAVVAIALPAPALAEGPNAIQSLPGCDANVLQRSDDDSSDFVPLGFTANFFGTEFSGVFVNDNGNVTFNFPFGIFTPYDFTATGEVIIAPFWSDVDTRAMETQPVTYGPTTVDGQPAFCVNWINVGYYPSAFDKLDSFQLLLVSSGPSPGDFDIVFNYDKILWESGEHSGGSGGLGGTSALMGYSNGDGDPAHFFIQPGSTVPGTFLDSNPNTGLIYGSRGTSQLGRYVFEVRNTPPAELGETVRVGLVSGTVLVREKGTSGFVDLQGLDAIPVGSSVDATDGVVRVGSETKAGTEQVSDFYDGRFRIDQRGNGVTDLKLQGSKFRKCKKGKRRALASKRLARLWGKGGGRHRTRGRRGAGTTRGTTWLTEERCNGTFFKVKEGTVAVRDFGRKRTVLVRAGEKYLARAR